MKISLLPSERAYLLGVTILLLLLFARLYMNRQLMLDAAETGLCQWYEIKPATRPATGRSSAVASAG